MTIGVVSLGCAKNRVDTEVMLGLLRQAGHDFTDHPAAADALIVNTCGFIEPAKEESIGAILDMARYKREGRCRALIVTGCLSQRYGQELYDDLPEVDAIVGVSDYDRIAEIVQRAAAERFYLPGGLPRYIEGVERVRTTPPYTAYVKVADGCDNRCSYCAIPGIRGPFASRPYDAVLHECRRLVQSGARELSLIAQDTTRFGEDLTGRKLLPQLLADVSGLLPGGFTRALYLYPARVDERLLDALSLPGVCPYLDIPMQHVSDRLLRLMNRRGCAEDLSRLHAAARSRGFTLRTTVICGFPGETAAEHQELLAFLASHPFDRLGAFAYSPEEDTLAADMPGQVDPQEAAARVEAVMKQQERISAGLLKRRVGRTERVLVEGREGGRYRGRTMAEAPESDGVVFFTAKQSYETGAFACVRIESSSVHDLQGVAE